MLRFFIAEGIILVASRRQSSLLAAIILEHTLFSPRLARSSTTMAQAHLNNPDCQGTDCHGNAEPPTNTGMVTSRRMR